MKSFTPPANIVEALELIRSLDRRRGRKPSKTQLAKMQAGRRAALKRARREKARPLQLHEGRNPLKRASGRKGAQARWAGRTAIDRLLAFMRERVAYTAKELRDGVGANQNAILQRAWAYGLLEAVENPDADLWEMTNPMRPRCLWRMTPKGVERKARGWHGGRRRTVVEKLSRAEIGSDSIEADSRF